MMESKHMFCALEINLEINVGSTVTTELHGNVVVELFLKFCCYS